MVRIFRVPLAGRLVLTGVGRLLADKQSLFFRNAQGEKKSVMGLRAAFFEGGVKALHRRIIHPGGPQHLNKQVLVDGSRVSPGRT
ncbi:MAG: hypothetical protein A4E72_01909 [Syntrophus sp. PtaU1.Bin208]|nr:MAG: hypothetical protein A4E72_01909 [Syntrophus sp. PtaU1.Bin208]